MIKKITLHLQNVSRAGQGRAANFDRGRLNQQLKEYRLWFDYRTGNVKRIT